MGKVSLRTGHEVLFFASPSDAAKYKLAMGEHDIMLRKIEMLERKLNCLQSKLDDVTPLPTAASAAKVTTTDATATDDKADAVDAPTGTSTMLDISNISIHSDTYDDDDGTTCAHTRAPRAKDPDPDD